MISSIFSLEVSKVVKPDPNVFLWIPASIADAAAVNLNGIKRVLANGFSTFPIKGNPVFNNNPRSIPKMLLFILFYVTVFLIILC